MMRKYHTPAFRNGMSDGMKAREPIEEFEMSSYLYDYKLGFVIGYSNMASFMAASQMVWAWEVGKLGKIYCLKLQDLEFFISNEDDDYLLQELRDAYYSNEDELYC